MAYLLFHLLIGLAIVTNTSRQAENDFGSCSSEIELTIEQREQHDEPTYDLYCKSRTKPFDDSAEFQVDGYSREHILIIKNRCFDRKKQECSLDYCKCDPVVNGFSVKFKMNRITVGQTFGCLVRIRNEATGNFLKILTSNMFNGTDFVPHECNVKVLGTTTDITNTTSNSSSPSDDIGNNTNNSLTIYLLIVVVTVVTIITILMFLVKWFKRSKTEVRSKTIEPEETRSLTEIRTEMLSEKIEGSKTEVRSKTIEPEETLSLTEIRTEMLSEKIEGLKTEVRSQTIEPEETLPLTEIRTQMLLEEIEALETELKIIKQEVESTDTPVLSGGIDAGDYFTINCESDITFFRYFNEEPDLQHKQRQGLQHEQGHNLQQEQELHHEQGRIFRNERILDMCFVEHTNELHLVYIDADNKKIVRQNIIPGKDRKECLLKKQPNRLSKINDRTVSVIYKKGLEVLIFNVKEMMEEKTCKISEQNILESHNGIQGILALSENTFILSDKMHLCVLKVNEHEPIVKKLVLEDKVEFDTARRLTHAITSDGKKDIIFIADENDKRVTSITIPPQNEEKESIAGHLITKQTDHNRGLQNVRAIVATQSRIYAATSAGISVFRHNRGYFGNCAALSEFDQNSKDYKMLVEYNKHVEHTRSLCIHTFREYIYVGLSCIIKQHDVILVFRLERNDVFK